MADTEQLRIIIDVIDSYSAELDKLLAKLVEIELAIDRIDGRNIDLDTGQAHASLSALQAQMASMNFGGGAAVRGGGGGGGGGGSRAARNLANATEELEDGFRASALRMSDLHNALAKIVPLLVVFLGALPAMIGGIVALAGAALAAAAALGAVAAFAGLGAAMARGDGDIMAGFEEILGEIQSDFMDAFGPLADRLAPLFEDALDGLDKLFQRIANEGDALVMLADQARAFGSFVIDTLPSFLRELAQFAEAAGPAIGEVVSALSDIDFFGMLAGILADTLPLLMDFGALLAMLLGHLYEMSLGFFQVANGVFAFINYVLEIITLGGMLNQELGFLAAALLAVYTATLAVNAAFAAFIVRALVSVGTTVLGAIQAFTGLAASEWVATAATYGLSTAFVALAGAIALTGIGALLVIVGGLGSAFSGASSEIDKATESLRAFENQRRGMTSGNNPYRNPDLQRGEAVGQSRFGGGNVNVTVEGDADADTVRQQSHNAMYRMERTRRRR